VYPERPSRPRSTPPAVPKGYAARRAGRAYQKPVRQRAHAFWRDLAGGEEVRPVPRRGPSKIASRRALLDYDLLQ